MDCAIYTRVSTDNQAEVEFNSCQAQEAKVRAFIKSQDDFRVFKAYEDGGFSGANLERPQLKAMLEDIKGGQINAVVAYKIDRLTRSPRDFYQLIELFEQYGVDFISVTERFDTSTPSGRLLRNIMLTFAQFERELTSERTKDKLLERAQKGMWNGGNVPFGYRTIDKRLEPDREKSQKLMRIFAIFTETGSLAKTYRTLKTQHIFNNKELPFSKSNLQSILRNIIYTGKIKYAGKVYAGIHKPLISEDIFNLAQEAHRKKIKTMRMYKEYSLTGLVKCKECNSNMTPCHTNKKRQNKRKRYYYYRCTKTFRRDWDSCGIRQVSADRLESYVFESLERLSLDKHYLDSLISKLNNSTPGDRIGLEPSKGWSDSAKITPQIFAQTLQHFVKILPEKKSIQKNLWAKKFIKKINYSKEEIVLTLYYQSSFNEALSLKPACGRPHPAAGRRESLSREKKISLTGTCKANHQEWLCLCDEIRTYFKGSL